MLKYDSEYVLEIFGNNPKNESIEGEKCNFEFKTPTCWQIYGYNLQKCRKYEFNYMDVISNVNPL